MQVSVLMTGRWTESQTRKVGAAVEALNAVLIQQKFIDAIAALDPQKYFANTLHKPKEIAQLISKDKMCVISAKIWVPPFWKRFSSAVAFESKNMINLRNSYVNNATVLTLGATLLHEMLHEMGYSHDFWSTKRRPYSVPYAIGNLVSTWKE